MRILKGILILGTIWLSACEDQVGIQVQPFESQPIIYCLIDPTDTIHSIRIERVFSGFQPPAITARNPDSLFFTEADVKVILSRREGGPVDPIIAKCVAMADKEPGYFASQKHYLYQFSQIMNADGVNLFYKAEIRVEIPGLPPATASCNLMSPPKIWSPNSAQQFIYIVPDNPLRIQWSGGSWNEVDIRFEIKEMYADSIATKILQFQKVNAVLINWKYYEVRIPYDLVVQGIGKNFKYRKDIMRRYFGPVYITINTGQEEYAKYIEYQGGINDFNQNPFSNIVNGLGLLTSKSSIIKGPMELDQASRFQFAADPVLKKLSFIEY